MVDLAELTKRNDIVCDENKRIWSKNEKIKYSGTALVMSVLFIFDGIKERVEIGLENNHITKITLV